ncbi:MAG TPA: tRNA (adenosine(37)-N6)-threonylcarbamoyltransferase complex ATPase subunit type 1 TsaE [Bacteroidales bacterium]|jgi:tRNA threonylcarbamoyladenosine biosynthesis protein TsaE|nr:tRNA (adenosine(37)-N6)-threonylcarbamoyltransferase complex ATPase subunit type 1 TsaE [Bacteroidales bacterium]
MYNIEINSIKELDSAARRFIDVTSGNRKFAFYGPMGSGKTTFIKAICRKLGATGLVTSPTFSLVNEYPTESGEVIYHFDLYRINSLGELYDLGYEEYFYSDNYVFIEWAEKAESLLPDPVIKVSMQEINQDKRLVTIALL